jgi:hypothetical protein
MYKSSSSSETQSISVSAARSIEEFFFMLTVLLFFFWKFGKSSEVQTFLLFNIFEQEEYLSSLGGD